MANTRYEKYKTQLKGFPFHMNTGLKRTPSICSTEPNRHENLEFQLCTEGSGNILLNGKKHTFGKGDIVAVNSNVIHYTFTETELTYTCLIISTEWCRQMNIDYDALEFYPVIRSAEVKELFSELEVIFAEDNSTLTVARANLVLLRLMIELVENFSAVKTFTKASDNSECVESVIDYIQNNFNRRISLDEIAKAVFLNKYTLCKEFKRYTGQTVFESLNRFRIGKAEEFIKSGRSVSETAFLCGFANLSFFTKTFKQYMGITPSQMMKSIKTRENNGGERGGKRK